LDSEIESLDTTGQSNANKTAAVFATEALLVTVKLRVLDEIGRG